MILLKVIIVRKVWFVTIGILIMGLNFKIWFTMVFMILQCCVLNLVILLLSLFKKVDYCCIFYGISKSEAIHLLKDSVTDDLEYI